MALPLTDRRKADAVSAAASDRTTKQLIVFAVCGIAVMFALTECRQSLEVGHVVPEINQMATLVIGALIGWLGKTGVDYVAGMHAETPPSAAAIGDAVGKGVVEASKDSPVVTEESTTGGEPHAN